MPSTIAGLLAGILFSLMAAEYSKNNSGVALILLVFAIVALGIGFQNESKDK